MVRNRRGNSVTLQNSHLFGILLSRASPWSGQAVLSWLCTRWERGFAINGKGLQPDRSIFELSPIANILFPQQEKHKKNEAIFQPQRGASFCISGVGDAVGDGPKTTKKRSQVINLTPYYLSGTPTRTRTWDLRFRKPTLSNHNDKEDKMIRESEMLTYTPACTRNPKMAAELQKIMDAWGHLPDHFRSAILSLVEATAHRYGKWYMCPPHS